MLVIVPVRVEADALSRDSDEGGTSSTTSRAPSIATRFIVGAVCNMAHEIASPACGNRIAVVESLKGRDFLTVADWSGEELLAVLDLADRLKDERKRYVDEPLLPGRSVGLLLEKPSLRTRVSFELAVYQLGGHAVHLTGQEVGLGLREATRDIAYVLSGYLDALMVRTFAQSLVAELAEHARIPVVNGLTDETHPCQALADAMTIRERLGGFDGVRVAWLGDGNNVCVSLSQMCEALGMEFVAATPAGYERPGSEPLRDPREAARGANVLVTDAWTSMGQEEEAER